MEYKFKTVRKMMLKKIIGKLVGLVDMVETNEEGKANGDLRNEL